MPEAGLGTSADKRTRLLYRIASGAPSERANGCSRSLTCRSTALIRIPFLPRSGHCPACTRTALNPAVRPFTQMRLSHEDARLIQKAKGIRYTIVNGGITFEESECTHATPGKFLRSYDMVNR